MRLDFYSAHGARYSDTSGGAGTESDLLGDYGVKT